ncbi:LysR family transcriptional regulator [Rhizobacter sp. J219]|uniref:LysR family transcriptional regulator n=1 Tax=Rhizobacter sp. J219 TaxID=2898430 RepID=UPI002151DF52|nr:LysR family transcriptional regulator [Rhizobacter sp. J219]MCR5884251.1 LysR family transcriptional regulator [Rhizobacter sp. J219]
MDRLHSMRVFSRVIEEGSFAGAARQLNLSAAVVTRLVADLEEHLGARLINRTTRRLALTDIGELYLERVRQILTEVEEAEALASAATSEPRGHLRVLVPPAFAVHQIAKHLPRFRELYPKVTLELAAPGPVETVDENYDVSIIQVGLQPLNGDFVARLLARSEVITCASPDYLDRHGRPKHPEELHRHEAMLPSFAREITFHRGPWGDDEPAGESVTLVPARPALSTIHSDTMYAAALAGMGISGLPSYVVEDALLEHALERVLPEWRVLTLRLYAAMPTRKYVPARTRAFIDFLVQTFGGREHDPWLQAAGCETCPQVAVPEQRSLLQ